jgi:hypothetical protein
VLIFGGITGVLNFGGITGVLIFGGVTGVMIFATERKCTEIDHSLVVFHLPTRANLVI